MINTILLHVGVHKTGTSTIQQSFGEMRHHLAQNGFLYPAFRIQEYDEFNHSIPMVSMFRNEPEKYRINVRKGFTTKYAVEKLNRSYDQQLKSQIQNFSGQTLIISGEGISSLEIPELERFKEYLISITNPQVKIKILMVIRHPVKWAVSGLQELIKSGNTLQSVLPKIANIKVHQFILKANNFRKVFGDDALEIQRYEDLAANKMGLFTGFIERFKILPSPSHTRENKRINQALTYESVTLLSAVYEHFPFYEKPDLEGLFREFDPVFLLKMPGVKFQLPEATSLIVWENSGKDVNELCRSFHLPEYNYSSDYIDNDKVKWSEASTLYLASVIEKLPAEIVPVVLRTLLSELKNFRKIWPLKKKLLIYAFLMFHSKYFNQNSKLQKMIFFNKQLGFGPNLYLAVLYKLFQPKLQASLTGKTTE